MSNYKITLQSKNPVTGRTQKFICPACGKKTFVRYWDSVNLCYLPGEFGRCDRENSCGHFVKPDGETVAAIIKDDTRTEPPKETPKFDLTQTFERAKVKYTDHVLKDYLTRLFGADVVAEVLNRCGVTGAYARNTIFWQINEFGETLTGKIILYQYNGHRNKNVFPNWVHNAMAKAGQLPKDYQPQKCLFGLHRLRTEAATAKAVYIVESEKTAIMAECAKHYGYFKNIIFLATGGKSFTGCISTALNTLKYYELTPYLVPDCDTTGQKWIEFAHANKLQVANGLFDSVTPEQAASGYDLGDLLHDVFTTGQAAPLDDGQGTKDEQRENPTKQSYDFGLYFEFPY